MNEKYEEEEDRNNPNLNIEAIEVSSPPSDFVAPVVIDVLKDSSLINCLAMLDITTRIWFHHSSFVLKSRLVMITVKMKILESFSTRLYELIRTFKSIKRKRL